MEEQLEAGIEQDENYRKLQAKVKENLIESLSTRYNLNEKGLFLYKDKLYVPNVPKIKLLILNKMHKNPYSGHPSYVENYNHAKKRLFPSKHEK